MINFIKPRVTENENSDQVSQIKSLLKVMHERIHGELPAKHWMTRPVDVFISDGYNSKTNRTMFICVNGSPNQMTLIVENTYSMTGGEAIMVINGFPYPKSRKTRIDLDKIPGGFDLESF